jgi:hypothetical protein
MNPYWPTRAHKAHIGFAKIAKQILTLVWRFVAVNGTIRKNKGAMISATVDLEEVEEVEEVEMEEEGEEEVDLSRRPVGDLKGTEVEYSCITSATRQGSNKERECVFCSRTFVGGPATVRNHIMAGGKRVVTLCAPKRAWSRRYKEVEAEMRKRVAVIAGRDAEASRLQVARANARAASSGSGNDVEARPPSMFKVPTAEDCNDQWARVVAKNNIPLILADCGEFRKLLLMVAQSGKGMISTQRIKGAQQTALCHRTKLTTKVLPRVDQALEEKMSRKVERIAKVLGCTGTGDGWKDPNGNPMLNFLQNVPKVTRFCSALDASGVRKSAIYQANFVIKSMEASGGIDLYVAVFFDGACEPSFVHIKAKAR